MILDSRIIKKETMERLKKIVEIEKLKGFVLILQVGNNEDSNRYIKHKMKALEEVGLSAVHQKYKEDVSEAEIIKDIEFYNHNEQCVGIIAQLPLPSRLNEEAIVNTIAPEKDIDGLTEVNLGRLFTKDKDRIKNGIAPATAKGIIKLLDYYGIEVEGKDIAVVGRSNLVGKSVALMLCSLDATVEICHSKTSDLKSTLITKDIVILAVGRGKMFDSSYFKKDAVVIDVGINFVDGVMCGDADFSSCLGNVKAITPVPYGVGTMTAITVIENSILLALKQKEKRELNERNKTKSKGDN